MKKLNKDNKGFSLVELLVVIAIMVVLVGVIAPSLLSNIEKTREAKDFQALDTIAGNIQAAMVNEDVYDAIITKSSFDLKAGYDGEAFNGTTGLDATLIASANSKLASSLTDSLATASIYGGASGAINLFGSKTAKAAVTAGAEIWVKVDSTTGKITVLLTSDDGANAVSGKSVDFTVTR